MVSTVEHLIRSFTLEADPRSQSGCERGCIKIQYNGPFSHTDGTRRWLHELKIEEVTYLRYQSIMGATLPVSSLSEQRRVPNATLKRGICGVHPNVMFFFPSTFFFLCNTIVYMLQLRVLLADPQPPSEFPRFLVPTSAAWHRVLARAQNASRKRSIASASE